MRDIRVTRGTCSSPIPQRSWWMFVRSREWTLVGLPDLSSLQRTPLAISWKFYPSFERNERFLEQLAQEVPDNTTVLMFLCKTGGRSLDAALAATAYGYKTCYNISGGFEGDANERRQRGTVNGWKSANLAWQQA